MRGTRSSSMTSRSVSRDPVTFGTRTTATRPFCSMRAMRSKWVDISYKLPLSPFVFTFILQALSLTTWPDLTQGLCRFSQIFSISGSWKILPYLGNFNFLPLILTFSLQECIVQDLLNLGADPNKYAFYSLSISSQVASPYRWLKTRKSSKQ